MKVRIEKLIKHLKTQLEVAKSLDSDWVYITKNEAKKCLELAEAEDEILSSLEGVEPIKIFAEGLPGYDLKCGACEFPLMEGALYCDHCGKKIKGGAY